MEGMAKLQLSWVTGKELVEIPLSVSVSSLPSPWKTGKSNSPINGMFVGQGEVGSTTNPGCLQCLQVLVDPLQLPHQQMVAIKGQN